VTQPNWWTTAKHEAHGAVFSLVRELDRAQFDTFNRFRQLESLYDTTPRATQRVRGAQRGIGRMHENVVASNVDALSAQVGTNEVRSVFDTDGADWSTQRRAKHLEWYIEGVAKLQRVPQKARYTFKAGACMKGNAVMKVWGDKFSRLRVESVMIDDIVVNELELRNGDPLHLHYRTTVDRDELKALYPKFKRQIEHAQGGLGQWQTWAGWRPIQRNEILVIESWRLPIGVKDHEDYVAGRHTVVIDGTTLLDEDYHEDFYPFAFHRFSRPTNGWYGIGLAERISGIQLALNRRNLQNERKLDHGAFPTTWVSSADAALASQQVNVSQNTLGTVSVYRGSTPPTTVQPPTVSPEELRDADRLSAKAGEVSGVNRMLSQGVKPAGIETGVALREVRDTSTQRFAEPEKDFENYVLDIHWLILHVCKQLGDKAPTITRRSRLGERKIKWSDVDMKEVRVWISAASTLSRTRAGREQTVIEWAQAGIISQDTAKRLMGHPDLEREMSLYTAAIENADECIEEIADGGTVTPEPFMNLKMLVWRGQQQYLNWMPSRIQCPESVLENLRSMIVNAAWMDSKAQQGAMAAAPDLSGVGAPPGPDAMPPAAAPPPMPTPRAAFAPQAMQLAPGV
jgi:hypothetical protein